MRPVGVQSCHNYSASQHNHDSLQLHVKASDKRQLPLHLPHPHPRTQSRIAFNSALIDALLGGLRDPDPDVCSTAISSLSSLAARGNTQILHAMIKYLPKCKYLDAVGVQLLGQTATLGHIEAGMMLVVCLASPGAAGEAALEGVGICICMFIYLYVYMYTCVYVYMNIKSIYICLYMYIYMCI